MTMTAGPNTTVRVKPRRSDPRKEQAAGGTFPWVSAFYNAISTLPNPYDDLTWEFGPAIYDQMMLDPQISGDVEMLKGGILAQGMHLLPAVSEPKGEAEDPDYQAQLAEWEQASEITAFCQWTTDNLQESQIDVNYDLLDCIPNGSRQAEQVYRDVTPGELARFPLLQAKGGALCLRAIKPKPRHALYYVVDKFLNVLGLLSRIGDRTIDTQGEPELLERRRFLCFTWRPKNCDPRGTSHLRAAYTAWWNKLQTIGEYLKYLTQFASPSLIALMDDAFSAQLGAYTDAEGNFVTDADGAPSQLDPITAVVNVLVQFRNGTAAALRGVKELIVVEMKGEGAVFLNKLDYWDRQISKKILGNALAGNEGKHGTRAQAEQANDQGPSLVVAYGKQVVEQAWHDDVFVPLVEMNYGPDAVALTPIVSLTPVESQDQADMLNALARVYASGYLDNVTDFSQLDAKFGLEVERDGPLVRAPTLPAGGNPAATAPDTGGPQDPEDKIDEGEDQQP